MRSFAFLSRKPSDPSSNLRERAELIYEGLRAALPQGLQYTTYFPGQHAQRRGGNGHEFWQYRDYQSGDSTHGIDWRQSAKTDKLLVRQKEHEIRLSLGVWLQNDAAMHYNGKYASGAATALALSLLCHDHHDACHIAGAGAPTPNQLTNLLSAQIPATEPQNVRGDIIFLIGDFLEPIQTLEDKLFAVGLSGRRIHLLQILDETELTLPYSGRIIFEHPNGADSEQILEAASIRQAYVTKLEDHLNHIKQRCHQLGWTYSLVKNNSDPTIELTHLLQSQDAGAT